ncbi:MAG: sulfotransferase domain-containing protein [Caldilineaceae bacterium]|nr:sulfotransferase domain-containing protein [Caldilineaceae bacterium]
MTAHLPQVTRTYQNFVLDSTRWQHYRPRADDIIVSTSYKSGTTWTQEIVRQLIFWGQDVPERDDIGLGQLSPWFEVRGFPLDRLLAGVEAQQHRRSLKTHLALDGLPYFPQVKYIVVGRDARDVAMSLWNHYQGQKDETFGAPDNPQGQLPPPPPDLHAFWQMWITRGVRAWESEGYPFWGNLHHTQTWWNYRHLPNLLFVHYADLKHDLAGEIRRIADFLTIPLTEAMVPSILATVTLDAMRLRADRLDPGIMGIFKEGSKTFYFKGTNGRWKDLLSADELALYEGKAAQVLTRECRAWLEQGRKALEPVT